MSHSQVWRTPLLLLATVLALVGVGIEVWLEPELSPIAWALAGISLTFTIGHAIGIGDLEVGHIRLVLLALAVPFVQLMVMAATVLVAALLVWMILVAFVQGDLFP